MRLQKDDIGFGGFFLWQDADAFRYGVDAVLLADFAVCGGKDRVMELGSGNGVVPLIIKAKYGPAYIAGIEKQESVYNLAVRNSEENGLNGQLEFFNIDVLDVPSAFPPASFDLVCSNPPYMEKGCALVNPDSVKHVSRHETTAGLEDFFRAAAHVLRPGGRLVMVHRPFRLPDLMTMSRNCGLEPKKMRLIVPHPGETPNIVLMEFVKGAGKELVILPQLCVRDAGGEHTGELKAIYGLTQ